MQTVIGRLEEKKWLKHREIGQAFLYSAVLALLFPFFAMLGQLSGMQLIRKPEICLI